MALKFLICSVLLIIGANCECTSSELKKEVKKYSEEYFIDSRGGCSAGEKKNYSFSEFEKVAEFLHPLIKYVESRKCRKQLEILVKSLQNSSLWAVQMFDASSKTPNGLLTSDAYDLGNFDSCVEINLKRGKDDNIFGKYCLIDLLTNELDNSHSTDPVSDLQLWEKIMVPIFKYGFINNLYRLAICVPNECLPEDIETVFRFLFNNTSRRLMRDIEISVPENACSIANEEEFKGVTVIKKITSFFFLWVVVITIFELLGWLRKSKNPWIKSLVNFSAYKNYKVLTSANCEGPVRVINSIKVYTVIILVITRRISLFLAGPIMNRKAVDQVFDESLQEIYYLISNTVAETFVVLDGFLHYYRVHSYYKKNSKMSIWRVYTFQVLTMCPLYLTAIFFYGYVFETLGTGPMWKEKTVKSVKNCRENWVINLMNLNNFLRVNDMCIHESWHFAVVAQCFVFVPVLVKATQKTSTSGKNVFKIIIATTCALLSVKLYYSLDSFQGLANESGEIYWHQKLCTKTLNRASAYFTGVLFSLIYLRIKEKKWTFWKTCHKTFFRTALGLCFLLLFTPLNSRKMSPVQKAYFFSITQILWCFFISSVVLGISTKRLTGIGPLLTGQYLSSLGRLSYSYLLVLDLVQIYSVGIMRTVEYFSLSRVIWTSSADLLAAYVVAFIFYMIIHRPISNMLHENFIKA